MLKNIISSGDLENKLRRAKTLGCVWFLKNTKERKKNVKENHFIIFSCLIKTNLSINEALLND